MLKRSYLRCIFIKDHVSFTLEIPSFNKYYLRDLTCFAYMLIWRIFVYYLTCCAYMLIGRIFVYYLTCAYMLIGCIFIYYLTCCAYMLIWRIFIYYLTCCAYMLIGRIFVYYKIERTKQLVHSCRAWHRIWWHFSYNSLNPSRMMIYRIQIPINYIFINISHFIGTLPNLLCPGAVKSTRVIHAWAD